LNFIQSNKAILTIEWQIYHGLSKQYLNPVNSRAKAVESEMLYIFFCIIR